MIEICYACLKPCFCIVLDVKATICFFVDDLRDGKRVGWVKMRVSSAESFASSPFLLKQKCGGVDMIQSGAIFSQVQVCWCLCDPRKRYFRSS